MTADTGLHGDDAQTVRHDVMQFTGDLEALLGDGALGAFDDLALPLGCLLGNPGDVGAAYPNAAVETTNAGSDRRRSYTDATW